MVDTNRHHQHPAVRSARTLTGLLAFIPNLGPIIGAAPAILLALPEGGQTVFLVIAVFLVVQSLESYVVSPLLQQRTVSLPPALIVAVQLLMGTLFGLIGLVLATPLAAVGMTFVNAIYVEDYLQNEDQANAHVHPND
ncbi:MAG: AI-2E family transporter [Rhodobacteraceae bacterium]|nr:AI-2E family transporter [Paracoccaceae bacterium]